MLFVSHRSPLAYPAGVKPTFDPTHIAAANITPGHGFSGVCRAGNFINLLTGKRGTIVGVPAKNTHGLIGQNLNYTANTMATTFANQAAVTDTNVTAAAILQFNGTTSYQCIFMSSNTSSGGIAFGLNQSGVNAVLAMEGSGGGGAAHLTSSPSFPVPFPASAPFFVVGSTNGVTTNFVAVRLNSGQTYSQTVSGTLAIGASDGTYVIGNYATLNGASTAKISHVMFAPQYLSLPALLFWAANPWAFWYPSVNDYVFDGDFVKATEIAIPVLDRQYRSRWL